VCHFGSKAELQGFGPARKKARKEARKPKDDAVKPTVPVGAVPPVEAARPSPA